MQTFIRPKNRLYANWIAILSGMVAVSMLAGCNFFAPFASSKTEDLNYQSLIAKGDAAVNKGQYPKAISYYRKAISINVEGTEAYLKDGKAVMSQYGIDYNYLNREFNKKKGANDSGGQKGIPFLDSTRKTVDQIDSVYYPIATAVRDLEYIIRHSTDTIWFAGHEAFLPPKKDTATDGAVTQGVARLDLGLLQAIKGMLAPLDLDHNDHIDSACGMNICPNISDAACYTKKSYTDMCTEGLSSEVKRFRNFKKLTEGIDINNISSDGVNARNVSSNPNDINAFLAAMHGPIAGSNHNLDSVDNALTAHKETKIAGQLNGVVSSVRDLDKFLGYMKYNDGIDNDFDNQIPPGTVSPMRWHDFDKDGFIRYDYFESIQPFPAYAGNLGHPLHRYLHRNDVKGFYVTIAELKNRYAELKEDTSKNSRIALMIKHCQEVADKLPDGSGIDGTLRNTLHNAICSTYTTIPLPDINPPTRSDWISGAYGIDEEAIDEIDNDMDGIKDEDGRNLRGYDDDNDGALSVDMLSIGVTPMAWTDMPGHKNSCIDIDTSIPLDSNDPRKFCMGTLEHRLYLAHDPTKMDSLPIYYAALIDGASNATCMDDMNKLNPAYLQAKGYSEIDKVIACSVKHIWALPRPIRSEWTSGVYGVDEEILDGIDNDGDGWIDEDLK